MKYDVESVAREMGVGLAVLHFEAGVDAMNTEFVLGSAADEDGKQRSIYFKRVY